MVKSPEFIVKEETFLLSMVDVGGVGYSGRKELAEKYREKYGCDPCDACGPDACDDCKACLEDSGNNGSINPFDRLRGRNN